MLHFCTMISKSNLVLAGGVMPFPYQRFSKNTLIQNPVQRILLEIFCKLRCFFCLFAIWIILTGASSYEMHPLAPPDTSSPRATLKSFIDSGNMAHRIFMAAGYKVSGKQEKIKELNFYIERAARCLNLSQVPPTVLMDTGIDTGLYLKEVLDRIEIPPDEEIPDRNMMKKKTYKKWIIPHTEIAIGLVKEGAREGEYLFTPETVEKIKGYYERVKHLPYKPGSSVGVYEDYIMASGWMVPTALIRSLPDFFKREFYEQTVWQWLGMLLLSLGGGSYDPACVLLDKKKSFP